MSPPPEKPYLSYEDYETSARYYDQTRVALGVDVIVGLLCTNGKPLMHTAVLDVGCGTGNYLRALAPYVRRAVGLEYSPAMLAQCLGKIERLDAVDLTRASAFQLPFRDACFDAVLFNQVAHHFDAVSVDQAAAGCARYPNLVRALDEAYRVLAPGGLVIMSHMSADQIRDGFWWAELIPEAMQRVAARYIPLPALEAMMAQVGLEYSGAIVPLDAILQARDYLDPEGPLSEAWRRGESAWSLAAEDELERGLGRLRAMLDDGTVHDWLAGREALRRRVGQTVFVSARRPR